MKLDYNYNYNNPSFYGRMFPKRMTDSYENFVYKNLISRLMDIKTRALPNTIRKSLQAKISKVELPLPRGKTYAWELNPNNCENYILFLHGVKGKLSLPPNQYFLENVMNTGRYGIITPEYRGTADIHRQKFTLDNTVEDARAALEYLYQKGIKPENITIVAHCMGVIPASKIAKENKNLHSMIMISPLSNGDNFGSAILKTFNISSPKFLQKVLNGMISIFSPHGLNIDRTMRDVDIPVTVVQLEKDKLIMPGSIQRLMKNIKNLDQFVEVQGGTHALNQTNCSQIVKLL